MDDIAGILSAVLAKDDRERRQPAMRREVPRFQHQPGDERGHGEDRQSGDEQPEGMTDAAADCDKRRDERD